MNPLALTFAGALGGFMGATAFARFGEGASALGGGLGALLTVLTYLMWKGNK